MTGSRHRAKAAALAPALDLRWMGLSVLALGAALAAGGAFAQEAAPEGTEAGAAEGAAAPAAEGAEAGTVVSHGYNFFGELKYAADFQHLDYVNPEAPKGGEISEWTGGTFDSFNPYTLAGNSAPLASIGHESILTGTADDPTSLYCLICTTMEYPEDLSWVIFNLRPEARFADGTPVTAEDVKFTFDILMEQGLESFRAAFGAMIAEVEVLDPARIRFTFAPDSPVRDRMGLAGGLPVLSQAWFERTGQRLDESSDEPMMGSGAYVLDSFDYGRRVVYARNPDYWGADLPINIGRNNFDRIRFEVFNDTNVAFEAFKAGEYTFRVENSSLQWATQYNFPAIEQGWVVQEEPANGNIPASQSWVFNLRDPKFEDPRVREALGLMFNFEWSNETLFYGLYERMSSFWTNQPEMSASGLPSEAEIAILQPLVDEGLLDASILTSEAVVPPVSSPERNIDRGNLRRASELLDEAGWVVGDDGVRRNADGEELEVVFLESQPTFERVLLPYIENLERLGVAARLDMVDPSQAQLRRDESDFDMANLSPAMSLEPGTELEQWFGSESAAESNRNLMGLQDPAIDRLAGIVANADEVEEMRAAVRALDRVLRAKLFWVPQWYKPTSWLAYYDMYDHPEPLPAYAVGELDFWWYDAEGAERLRAAGAVK
jgi:microcin C transport system substrate-binding protein